MSSRGDRRVTRLSPVPGAYTRHMRRENLILTESARVASIDLEPGEESPWHHHTEVTEHVICLAGSIALHFGNRGESVVLTPGERYAIAPGVVHTLVNAGREQSTYLLVQKGSYDFVPGNP